MTKCPRNRRVIDPCPRKVYTGKANACQPCIDQHRECVAVVATAIDNQPSPTVSGRKMETNERGNGKAKQRTG